MFKMALGMAGAIQYAQVASVKGVKPSLICIHLLLSPSSLPKNWAQKRAKSQMLVMDLESKDTGKFQNNVFHLNSLPKCLHRITSFHVHRVSCPNGSVAGIYHAQVLVVAADITASPNNAICSFTLVLLPFGWRTRLCLGFAINFSDIIITCGRILFLRSP